MEDKCLCGTMASWACPVHPNKESVDKDLRIAELNDANAALKSQVAGLSGLVKEAVRLIRDDLLDTGDAYNFVNQPQVLEIMEDKP